MESKFNIQKTIGFSLHHASYLMKVAMKAELQKAGFDITAEEFVLLNLVSAEGIAQADLITISMKDKTNVTRLIGRLEKKGWVKREELDTNRRQQIISLTKSGVKTQKALLSVVRNLMGHATENISKERIEIANEVLGTISRNLS